MRIEFTADCCRETINQMVERALAQLDAYECAFKLQVAANNINIQYIIDASIVSCENLVGKASDKFKNHIKTWATQQDVTQMCPGMAKIIQTVFNEMNKEMACLAAQRFLLFKFVNNPVGSVHFNDALRHAAVPLMPFQKMVYSYYEMMMECSLRFVGPANKERDEQINTNLEVFLQMSNQKKGDDLTAWLYPTLNFFYGEVSGKKTEIKLGSEVRNT